MRPLTSLLLASSYISSLVTAAEPPKYPNSVKLSYSILGSSSQPSPLAEILYDPTTLKYHLASWTPPTVDEETISSSDPTSDPTSSKLVRILLPDGTSSSITSLSAFAPSLSQDINLWLSSSSSSSSSSSNPNHDILSASISSISPPALSDDQKRQKRKEERALSKGKPIPTTKPTKPKKPSTKTSSKSKKSKATPLPPGDSNHLLRSVKPIVKVTLHNTSLPAPGTTPSLLARPAPKVDDQGREVAPEPEVQEKSFFQKYWWVFLIGTVIMMGGGGEK